MLSDFSDKTFLIRCDDCGFRYRVLQASAVRPVCPCCGAEKPAEVIERSPAEKTTVRPLAAKPAGSGENITPNQVLLHQNRQRWGILFASVCIQWAIILISPFYIYYQLQKPELLDNNKNESKEEVVKDTSVEIKAVPDIPPQINLPVIQQTPELNGSAGINTAGINTVEANSAEKISAGENPVDEIARLLENRSKASPQTEVKSVQPKVAEPIIAEKDIKELPEKSTPVNVFESVFSVLPPVSSPAVPLPAAGGNAAVNNFKTENSNKKIDSKESVTQYKAKLTAAEKKLDEVHSLIPIAPESALEKGVEAVQLFRQLGQNVPSSSYWLISQAFASQGWGKTLAEHTLPVVSMDISSDSRWLLSQNEEHRVIMRDIIQQNPQTGSAADNAINIGDIPFVKLLFTPDNRFIIGNAEDGTIRIWDITQKEPAQTVKILKTDIRHPADMQISPDGKWLACCNGENDTGTTDNGVTNTGKQQNGNAVYLWNIGQLTKGIIPPFILLRGHEKPIRTMVFSPDSGSLVTGSDDSAARVYDLKAAFPGACQAVLKGHKDGITAVAVAPNGKWIATGSRDQTIRLWSLSDGNSAGSNQMPDSIVLSGHIGWISALVIDNNSDRLISGSYDRTIRLWKIPQGNIQKAKGIESIEIPNDQGTVNKLLLSKDGRILVSLGSDAGLRLRELNRSISGEQNPNNTLMLRNKMLPIQQVMLTPDSRYLIFSYLNLNNEPDSGIRIWSLQLDDLLNDVKN